MFCGRCHREFQGDHRFCPYDGQRLVESPQVEKFDARETRQRGAVFGSRYEIRGLLGRGAMARVYLAQDLESGAPVAIKVLNENPGPREAPKGESARDRFLREATTAARIGHPNIVKVFDSGLRPDGHPYIVMEFLYGESLGDHLRRERRMSGDIALPVLKQAASALAAAHAAGIVHRDVKPDNIFLVGEPGHPYGVKLLDFGLAKVTNAPSNHQTQAGVAVGTLEFMAPEQVVTDRPDARTDVYGLGIVMYRMFTGRLPFVSQLEAELLALQLWGVPPPPSQFLPGLDRGVEGIILRALRKDPDNRYPSMGAFVEDLERALGERPGPAGVAPPLARPDLYPPKGTFAKGATQFFKKKLPKGAPSVG